VLNGMLKHAKHDPEAVGTSGEFTPRPTGGGIDLTGAELALREINVDAFALAPIAAAGQGSSGHRVARARAGTRSGA